MGRTPQPGIRDALLDAATDWSLRNGLPERLEPLAEATGASTRMLLYHFTSKDELLRAILRCARDRQLRMFGDLLHPREDVFYPVVLERAWLTMSGPDGEAYLRMFGQLRQHVEQRLWPGFREVATTDWLGPLRNGLSSIGCPELATLVLAVIRGLLMDLEATDDRRRVDEAFHHLVDLLETRATGEVGEDA